MDGFRNSAGMKVEDDFLAEEQYPRKQANIAQQRYKLRTSNRIKDSVDCSSGTDSRKSPKDAKHLKHFVQASTSRPPNMPGEAKRKMNNLKTALMAKFIQDARDHERLPSDWRWRLAGNDDALLFHFRFT